MFSSSNNGTLKGAVSPLVDVHTHMYPPKYMEILRARANIPKVVKNNKNEDRLVILPNEKVCETTGNVGRPIGAEYFDAQEKLTADEEEQWRPVFDQLGPYIKSSPDSPPGVNRSLLKEAL